MHNIAKCMAFVLGLGIVNQAIAQTPVKAPPESIQKSIRPHGNYNPHSKLKPEQHIQVALKHKAEGRIAEALHALGEAIRQHGNNKDLYAVRGSIYLEQDKAALALSDLQKALTIDSNDARVLTNRAQVYVKFGQIKDALADLDKAVELNPDLLAARFNRGAIYYSSSEFNKALEDFDACIAIDPHVAGPYFNRASTKHALGNIKGAREDLQRFKQISKNEKWQQVAEDLLKRWQESVKEDKK